MESLKDIPVNDGKGIFDSIGLIDTLTVDCQRLLKAVFSGDLITFEVVHIGMIQKLSSLKNGVKAHADAQAAEIASLRRLLNDINNAENEGGES